MYKTYAKKKLTVLQSNTNPNPNNTLSCTSGQIGCDQKNNSHNLFLKKKLSDSIITIKCVIISVKQKIIRIYSEGSKYFAQK